MKNLFKIVIIMSFLLGLSFQVYADSEFDRYGAISYSPSTRILGYSRDYPDKRRALIRANKECGARLRKYAGRRVRNDCRVVVWAKNACLALASSRQGAYGAAWALNLLAVTRSALHTCQKYPGGKRCRLRVRFCMN